MTRNLSEQRTPFSAEIKDNQRRALLLGAPQLWKNFLSNVRLAPSKGRPFLWLSLFALDTELNWRRASEETLRKWASFYGSR